MSEFTSTGVVTKTLDEWYDAVVAFKRAVWGEDFVIDPTTKQGADILQLAELLYNAEMNNVSAFAQLNLDTATGVCLDYIGMVRGISRNGGYPQEIKVDLTSSVTGYNLTPDVVFKTTSGYSYYVPSSTPITSLQQQVTLIYSSDGNPPVNPGDPLQTVTANANIVSAVIAAGGITEGADTESDALYRKRIKDAAIGFVGTLELMASEMLKISGLAKLKIAYNDTAATVDNIPAYATEFLVVPNDENAGSSFNSLVANKILEVKVPGAPLYGTTTVSVPDYYGETKSVKFTRATKVEMQFYAQIAAKSATEPLDVTNVALEKQAIVDYIQSVNIGAPVSWSEVLGIVASDAGFKIVDWGLRKGTSGNWVNTDISCNAREYLWAELADIGISTDPHGGF